MLPLPERTPRDQLGRRALTAGLLIPLVAAGVLTLPTPAVGALLGAVVVAAAWEWAGLAGWPAPRQRATYALGTGFVLLAAYGFIDHAAGTLAILIGGLCWWLWAVYWVARFQWRGTGARAGSGAGRALSGWLVLVPAWSALVDLHGDPARGPEWVLYILVLIWCADSGAYFAGRRWGSLPLAPRISPGKTWEGAAGALAVVAIAAAGLALSLDSVAFYPFTALCVVTVPVSILGDLVESLCKRRAGVKDSGALVPGHGGVLDRIDSLTAAAPFFVLGLSLMEGY